MIHYLEIQDDADCFKEIRISASKFKPYSPTALDQLKKKLLKLDVERSGGSAKLTGDRHGSR